MDASESNFLLLSGLLIFSVLLIIARRRTQRRLNPSKIFIPGIAIFLALIVILITSLVANPAGAGGFIIGVVVLTILACTHTPIGIFAAIALIIGLLILSRSKTKNPYNKLLAIGGSILILPFAIIVFLVIQFALNPPSSND